MTEQYTKQIEDAMLDVVYAQGGPEIYNIILQHGLGVLPILAKHLSKDLPIEVLEGFEGILKAVLRTHLNGVISGEMAREVALFQKNIGFLCKYKSYAIKAASPLGYSIFIQNEGEGFSFQQHVSHKTEVFHILKVKPGGYVFICNYEDWARYYENESFSAWLSGQPDERYDQYRFEPEPGDVFVIDQLRVVHSVIGCILEEFATVSTDMVDRLYNQNAGQSIPTHFTRHYVQEQLRGISTPNTSRHIEIRSQEKQVDEIVPVRIPGGQKALLARTSIIASCYVIEPGQTTELQYDNRCAASIYITEGTGHVIIGEPREVRRSTPPAIAVCAGDLLMIPTGIYYGFVNEGTYPLKLSEHKIPLEVAFV